MTQKLHRYLYDTGSAEESGSTDAVAEFREKVTKGGGMNDTANVSDPYTAAFNYGERAKFASEQAVSSSNTLLKSAQDLIDRMKAMKPWVQVNELGQQAEDAGKQVQELLKNARPFIFGGD